MTKNQHNQQVSKTDGPAKSKKRMEAPQNIPKRVVGPGYYPLP